MNGCSYDLVKIKEYNGNMYGIIVVFNNNNNNWNDKGKYKDIYVADIC